MHSSKALSLIGHLQEIQLIEVGRDLDGFVFRSVPREIQKVVFRPHLTIQGKLGYGLLVGKD